MCLWSGQSLWNVSYNIVISFNLACSSKNGCSFVVQYLLSAPLRMRKEEMWHRSYWEEVHRLKKMKITRDRLTLDVLCCISLLFYLRKIGDLQIQLSCVPNIYLILFRATNHPQVLFFSTLFRCILVFTNLSEFHYRGSKICAPENDSRIVTNSFAVSVFPSVCPAVKPRGKRGVALNCR
jgi:hypothetical protein